jgi:CHAT domain/Tetratricopeptide repeat
LHQPGTPASWRQAIEHYTAALALWRAVADRVGEATTLHNLGELHKSLGDHRRSLEFYTQALAMREADGNRQGQAATLGNLGEVYYLLDERQTALDLYGRALPLWRAVDDQSGEVATINSLAVNLAAKREPYEQGVDLLMDMHRQRPSGDFAASALELSERARARSLLEILIEANADIRQGVEPRLLERDRSLEQKIGAKRQEQVALLNGRYTDEQADAVKRALEALLTAHQEVLAEIRQSSPRYAALLQPQPLTVDEIRRVLSLVDRRGDPLDGFLRALEIYNLKLRAELVVLSACRTALGKEVKGEGFIGLVRGFMYAGAARIVASMWDVRDQATATLMKRFYEGMLKKGQTPAAALRSAQISMWRDRRWEAPYYWAGFVIQGEFK